MTVFAQKWHNAVECVKIKNYTRGKDPGIN